MARLGSTTTATPIFPKRGLQNKNESENKNECEYSKSFFYSGPPIIRYVPINRYHPPNIRYHPPIIRYLLDLPFTPRLKVRSGKSSRKFSKSTFLPLRQKS